MKIVDRGSGPPLVLIPGIQGRWEYMQPAIESLARSFRVITFALGDEPSSGFAFDAERGFDNYVAQVCAALDQTGIGQAIVCGVSFGGLVALRVAAEHPERTASLILVSTPGPGWHLRPRHEMYARMPYLFGWFFVAETPWRLRIEMAAAFPARSARWRFAASQLLTAIRAPLSLQRTAGRARMIGKTAAAIDCARVTVPTLVVTGEAALDHIVPASDSASYASLIPGAEGVVLERTGHLGCMTQPSRFAAVVRAFTDRPLGDRSDSAGKLAPADRSRDDGPTTLGYPVSHDA